MTNVVIGLQDQVRNRKLVPLSPRAQKKFEEDIYAGSLMKKKSLVMVGSV